MTAVELLEELVISRKVREGGRNMDVLWATWTCCGQHGRVVGNMDV
jgi:hypothetical protein